MNLSRVPFFILSTYDYPNEQLDTFNKFFLLVIDENAPLKKVKMTRTLAQSMKDLQINKLE